MLLPQSWEIRIPVLRVPISDRAGMPDIPGIYVVLSSGVPIYIGQSKRTKTRLMNNIKRFLLHGADEVRVLRCGYRVERYNVETYLLNRFRPVLNVSLNSTTCAYGIYPIAPRAAEDLGLI
jgi:excinuclease UvrABC nuclease subunit